VSKQIPLTKGLFAIIDDEDYERISSLSWRAKTGWSGITYAIESGNPWRSMHRFIMECPFDKMIDHINKNGLDNRRCNLRITTNSGNQHNRAGVKGYRFDSIREKWRARITIDHKQIELGFFDTEEEAANAYREAKATYHDVIFHDEESE
jgi:hypothetical protein